MEEGAPRSTPLAALHDECGARLVPFAGWHLPLQFKGVIKEHRWTREHAGLFDVSHMGQVEITGGGATAALEQVIAANLDGLGEGRARYALMLNEAGGIIDDLMITRTGEEDWFVVLNAARTAADLGHLREHLGDAGIGHREDRALLALQGPAAHEVMSELVPQSRDMVFRDSIETEIDGRLCRLSRLGYTGEDGFEIAMDADEAEAIARRLLAFEEVEPAGLAARDSLRLEAGLRLHGMDIDEETTPHEAGLAWTIGKRRLKEGGFLGAETVMQQRESGTKRVFTGIVPESRPAREDTPIIDDDGRRIGTITSGGYGPSFGGPISMGYIESAGANGSGVVKLLIRERAEPARLSSLPFVPHRFRLER